MRWEWKSREHEIQRIEARQLECQREIFHFSSTNMMENVESCVIQVRGQVIELFESDYRKVFSDESRLELAIDIWELYPVSLLRNIDEYWPHYQGLDSKYSLLENLYLIAHVRATEYLMSMAETLGYENAAISVSGRYCREMVKNRRLRQGFWGVDCTFQEWPECVPNLMDLPHDIRIAIMDGARQVDRLSRHLESMRTPQKAADSFPASAFPPIECGSADTPGEQPKLVAPAKASASGNRRDRTPTTLQVRHKKAWSQYQRAQEDDRGLKTDREVYDWYAGNLADKDEVLLIFDTWAKYVRVMRTSLGQQKNKRGVGYETHSVVSAKRLYTPPGLE